MENLVSKCKCIYELGVGSNFITDGLKSKIIEILLDDPDSEVKKITEDYLIQCLYDATNDPENNPVLFQFFEKERQDRMKLWDELGNIRNELKELKEKLGKAGIDINYWEN
jgi:hypothetical protein